LTKVDDDDDDDDNDNDDDFAESKKITRNIHVISINS